MKARLLLALTLAFGSLFLVNPAEASDWQVTNGLVREGSVQFDYRGGTASQTLQAAEGSTLTITVNNTIANCIGACQPLPDTWSLTINGERWDGNSIDIITIQTIVSGEVTITATGIDRGFWAGWYGPIFSAPILTEPAPETGTWENQQFTATAPAGEVFTAVTGWYGSPTDATCGADVSSILATFLGGSTFTVDSSNAVFGDPCGGVVKVLRVQLISGAVSADTIDTTDTTDSTDAVDQSTDTTEPVMPAPIEPIVTPPAIEPQPQPQPLPFPVIPAPVAEPEAQPIVEPTPEPASEVTLEPVIIPLPVVTAEPALPSPEPSEEATAEPEPTVTPEPSAKAPETVLDKLAEVDPQTLTPVEQAVITQQAFAVLAIAEQGSPAYEQALEALALVAVADDPELPADLAAIPFVGDVAGAVLDTFNAVGNLGADISPKERKRGQRIVVGTVIVGQMASVALLRR